MANPAVMATQETSAKRVPLGRMGAIAVRTYIAASTHQTPPFAANNPAMQMLIRRKASLMGATEDDLPVEPPKLHCSLSETFFAGGSSVRRARRFTIAT